MWQSFHEVPGQNSCEVIELDALHQRYILLAEGSPRAMHVRDMRAVLALSANRQALLALGGTQALIGRPCAVPQRGTRVAGQADAGGVGVDRLSSPWYSYLRSYGWASHGRTAAW